MEQTSAPLDAHRALRVAKRANALGVRYRILLRKEGVATLLTHPSRLHASDVRALLLDVFAKSPGSWPPQEVEPHALHLGDLTQRVACASIQLGADDLGRSGLVIKFAPGCPTEFGVMLALMMRFVLSHTGLTHPFSILLEHGHWAKWTLPMNLSISCMSSRKILITGLSARLWRRQCDPWMMLGIMAPKAWANTSKGASSSFIRTKRAFDRKSRTLKLKLGSSVNALGL